MSATDLIPSLGCSIDYVSEQAYLVSLGVRPMALVSHIDVDEEKMTDALHQLRFRACGYSNVISFVIPSMNNRPRAVAHVGYTTKRWAVDLLKWAVDNAPERYADYVIGLLLGYSPGAIEEYEMRMFANDLTTPPTSSCRSDDNTG